MCIICTLKKSIGTTLAILDFRGGLNSQFIFNDLSPLSTGFWRDLSHKLIQWLLSFLYLCIHAVLTIQWPESSSIPVHVHEKQQKLHRATRHLAVDLHIKSEMFRTHTVSPEKSSVGLAQIFKLKYKKIDINLEKMKTTDNVVAW